VADDWELASGRSIDVMHLMVPPYVEHLDVVRALVQHAALSAGLGDEERADICLAVDELGQLVLAATDFAILVTVAAEPSVVLARIVARARPGAHGTRLSGVSQAVLARAVDFFALDPGDDALEGLVVKCRAGTPLP
jgi:hypothetical protein